METVAPTQFDRLRDAQPDPAHEKPLERARRSAEDFLARFHPDRHSAILRGALAAAYIGETPTSDVAAWLQGPKSATGRTTGIGNKTNDALREIGLLDELQEIDGKLLSYPRAEIRQPHYRTVQITGVDDAWHAAHFGSDKLTATRRQHARQQVKTRLEGELDLDLTVRREGDALIVYNANGQRFGVVKGDRLADGETIRLRYALAEKGTLRARIEEKE